ncbi:MAG: hemolysin family protein [Treponema sp.]|nr:hemolysin family protein [Treponema sp.]
MGIVSWFKKTFSSGSGGGITEEELRNTLLEGEKSGIVETEERSMVEGVFYLGEKPVSAFMTHRSEISWLSINATAFEARGAADSAADQSCLPLTNGDLDDVIGAIAVQDLYRSLLNTPWGGLRAIMRPPFFIPETMTALKAFEAFKKADAQDLFVMDEYGGFAGILTVRNLIEEIVGGLSASEEELESMVRQEDGSWIAGGGLSIDDAMQELKLETMGEGQGEYHTLAGFILYLAGEIPRQGAFFDYQGYRFMILRMDNNRIEQISITPISG